MERQRVPYGKAESALRKGREYSMERQRVPHGKAESAMWTGNLFSSYSPCYAQQIIHVAELDLQFGLDALHREKGQRQKAKAEGRGTRQRQKAKSEGQDRRQRQGIRRRRS